MEVNASDFKEFQRFKLIPELAILRDRVKLFGQKYEMDFEKFEVYVAGNKENFNDWDNLIEWKAYIESIKDIELKLDKL